MTRSISRRLAVRIILLMLSFSAILLIANSLLLKPLYEYSLKENMAEGIQAISSIDYTDETDEWLASVQEISAGQNYDVTIIKSDTVIYSSSQEFGLKDPNQIDFEEDREKMEDGPVKRDKRLGPIDLVKNWETYDEGIQVGHLDEPDGMLDLYIMSNTTNSDIKIYLTQGVEPVIESVRQANILLAVVTVLFMLVAILVTWNISKKFTHPISMMQKHVNQLSNLEFDSQLEIKTEDELEVLSNDINHLSRELQSALETLQEQNLLLEKENDSQRKLISNISHELRTPLTLIKGYVDEINQGYVKDPAQERIYTGYIAEETVKMKRLIKEILELSRIESGHMTFYPISVDVKDVIESFVDKYIGFVEEYELDVKMDLDSFETSIDPMKFEQVLANYLSNAGKYCDSDKRVEFVLKESDGKARVTVRNSGKPISREVRTYIWDGFYKADESRHSYDSSYGLGLSIVKAICEKADWKYGCLNSDGFVEFWVEIG